MINACNHSLLKFGRWLEKPQSCRHGYTLRDGDKRLERRWSNTPILLDLCKLSLQKGVSAITNDCTGSTNIWRREISMIFAKYSGVIGGERFRFNPFWDNSRTARDYTCFPREDGNGPIMSMPTCKDFNILGWSFEDLITFVKFFLDRLATDSHSS
ncbi:hypothetical protein Tco_0857629 [Tanacetum coccineum]|uniref:Uncharacterized protein n=1 Tax=Tanacetum coccineum TaxID=301880 RepID=A0ABQ5BA51_9ASTR